MPHRLLASAPRRSRSSRASAAASTPRRPTSAPTWSARSRRASPRTTRATRPPSPTTSATTSATSPAWAPTCSSPTSARSSARWCSASALRRQRVRGAPPARRPARAAAAGARRRRHRRLDHRHLLRPHQGGRQPAEGAQHRQFGAASSCSSSARHRGSSSTGCCRGHRAVRRGLTARRLLGDRHRPGRRRRDRHDHRVLHCAIGTSKPGAQIAEQSLTGPATNIIAGLGVGMSPPRCRSWCSSRRSSSPTTSPASTASPSPRSACSPPPASSSPSTPTGRSPTTPAASPR
jgi:hypothetical protein